LHGIGRHEADQRGDVLLGRVGLIAAADRRVGTYSGGMRRRLDLALSLVHEPTVLFLDEPTTGLDPTSRLALWDEVRRLNAEGTTVFLTTQYLEEADELAGRIAIIDGGKIVREGQPSVLKAAVGAHTLVVTVTPQVEAEARAVLEAFGEDRTADPGSVAIGLAGGPAALPAALRALGDAGVDVEHVELDAPSLDDVFADATGRRLEGSGGAEAFQEPA
jgi:ABC-2 type transport system ATP-binding protein